MNPLAAETTEATTSSATHTPKELARLAVEANRAHQYALTKYTEQLEEELLQVDKLLVRRPIHSSFHNNFHIFQ